MRVDRSLKFLTILATFTACSAPAATPDAAPPVAIAAPVPEAAPAPEPAPAPAPPVVLSARWDPRPLDLEYQREVRDMDARFRVETATPRAGESRGQRDRRHSDERKALELRYSHGKRDHARGMPPA